MEKVSIAILGCAIYWIGATWHYQPYHHPKGVTEYLQSTTIRKILVKPFPQLLCLVTFYQEGSHVA